MAREDYDVPRGYRGEDWEYERGRRGDWERGERGPRGDWERGRGDWERERGYRGDWERGGRGGEWERGGRGGDWERGGYRQGREWEHEPFYQGGGYGYRGGYGPQGGYGGHEGGYYGGWGQGGYGGWGPGGYGGRRYQGTRPDEEIEDELYDMLENDPRFPYDADIDVRVENGTVTLSGNVRSRHIKMHAGNCAWQIPGVRDVNNNITVTSRRRSFTTSGQQPGQARATETTGTRNAGETAGTRRS